MSVSSPPRLDAKESPQRPTLATVLDRYGRSPLLFPVLLAATVMLGAVLRLVALASVGYNSDEAVYAGQAAALANNPLYSQDFPVFRAHPLLFQIVLSTVFHNGDRDLAGRLVAVVLGLATVVVVYLVGRELYSREVGLLAALFLAVMPYHVVVTRQVLLDGPMTLLSTATLLMLALYGRTNQPRWLLAAGGMLGLTMLTKETSLLFAGSIYAFLVLTPTLRRRFLAGLGALGIALTIFAVYPLAISLAGHKSTGSAYLAWQLLRAPNHSLTFYLSSVPLAVGPLLVILAAAGLWWGRRRRSWRETLLLAWVVVPFVAFELLPTKGYQYLLGIAPAVAVLAARALFLMPSRLPWPRVQALPARAIAAAVVALSLLIPTWGQVHVSNATTFLAGTGGVPGGRETGRWLTTNTPMGSRIITLGPSMANIVQFYGHRQALGLSVSPNPLRRNPAYAPINNPDSQLRQGNFQYVVWDAYSAARSPFFAEHALSLARRFHGRVVHTESVPRRSASGATTTVPVVVVYQVRP